MDEDTIDFVISAWLEDGQWQVTRLPRRTGISVAALTEALSAQPSEGSVIGFLAVSEDFFVIVRMDGAKPRFLLSDVSAAEDWSIAEEILDSLEMPMPEEDEFDELTPAGDLTLLADLGMPASEFALLAGDLDMYPDEVLSAVSVRLGFGDQFESLLDQSR
ncbi:MAG: tRNA adenosine deaminase-associated protein [Candidatus Nanopelagicales bacterium]